MYDSCTRMRLTRAVPRLVCIFGVCVTLALLVTVAMHASAKTLKPGHDYSEICRKIASHLPRRHLLRMPLDDTISSRAWTNYLSSLDYERAYFLDADIQALREYETTLDDRLKEGNMQFGFEAFELFKKRMSNRVDFVDRLLDKGFDLEKKESYNWKRDEAEWVSDDEKWDDLWRKKIKNEYIRIVVNRELDAMTAAQKTNVTDVVVASTNRFVQVDTQSNASSSVTTDQSVSDSIQGTPSTNALAASAISPQSPETIIRKRYHQVMTILQDSDSEWVLQKFLTACTQAYDPHSSYLPRSAVDDFEIEMKLSLVGIGALLRSEDGAAKIVRLIPGGPAHRDERDISLKPGDKIIAVGQGGDPPVDVLHWPLHKIVDRIRGEKATTVVLTVIPASDPTGTKTKKVDLVRDEVKLEEQAASGHLRDFEKADANMKLGVIGLPAFYASMNQKNEDEEGYRSSVKDVRDILWDMQTNKVQGVLLDLRNNGGGSLLEAINMTGLFISRGPTVQVKEKRLKPLENKNSVIIYDRPLVVLVNRLSASASEIVAGALQDYGRAIIVGDSKTHGKGTVQTVFDVGKSDDLGALKVTTASYYRISGASTQLKGITPDIVVSSPWDFTETGEETLRNPIPWSEELAVQYDQVMDLQEIVPQLRARSKERRSKDERFKAYEQLLERVAALNREPVLSLNVDERRELAEAEQRLTDLQNQLASEAGNDADDDDSRDLVLMEGLAILSDLVDMQEEIRRYTSPIADDAPQIRDSVVDWFRNNI